MEVEEFSVCHSMNLLPFQSSRASQNEIYFRNCPYPTTRFWLHEQEKENEEQVFGIFRSTVFTMSGSRDEASVCLVFWPRMTYLLRLGLADLVRRRSLRQYDHEERRAGRAGWSRLTVVEHILGLAISLTGTLLRGIVAKGTLAARNMCCWCLRYGVTVGQWGAHAFLQDAHMPMVRSTGIDTSCSLQMTLCASVM